MYKALSLKQQKMLVVCLLALILFSLLWAVSVGQGQDNAGEQNYSLFRQADQLVLQGNFVEADRVLQALLRTYPDSYVVMWKYAFSLSRQGKYPQAVDYYTKARQQRPFLVDNPQFLVAFAEALVRDGQFAKAKQYLARAQSLNSNPGLAQYIAQLLKAARE